MKKFSHQSDIFELSKFRRRLVLISLLFFLITLFGRALYLQQFQKNMLQNYGDSFIIKNEVLHSNRGKITDRNNHLLAVNSPTYDVGISLSVNNNLNKLANKELKNKLEKLASILQINKDQLISKIESKSKGFMYIKRGISPLKEQRLSKLNLNGLVLDKKYQRFYPEKEYSAHVVGHTNRDGVGNEGLEKKWDSTLKAEKGHKKVLVDGNKRIIDDLQDFKIPKNGADIALTLDKRLQHSAYESLTKYIKRYEAQSGSVILLDAKNGDILAMTNYPSYNPNLNSKTSKKDLDHMRNRSITDSFEPGSTMKPISIAFALEQNKVTANEIIDTNNGLMKVGRREIKDAHPSKELSVQDIVKVSSNVGASKIGSRLSKKELWSIYNKFGFGKKINIGMPGESAGKLHMHDMWADADHATLPYGYGLSVNLLQLAQAYTVFANEGRMVVPKIYLDQKPNIGERVLSKKTSNQMKLFMQSVVEDEDGTGTKARIPGYSVAGKTGTAKKVINGVYEKEYVASFVGMAPSSNPKFIMAVMIDKPQGESYYGGTVAGPVFKEVMKDALKLYDIPYDRKVNKKPTNKNSQKIIEDAKL